MKKGHDERLNTGICPALNFDLVYIIIMDSLFVAAEPFVPWRSGRTRKTGGRFSAHFHTRTQRSYQEERVDYVAEPRCDHDKTDYCKDRYT